MLMVGVLGDGGGGGAAPGQKDGRAPHGAHTQLPEDSLPSPRWLLASINGGEDQLKRRGAILGKSRSPWRSSWVVGGRLELSDYYCCESKASDAVPRWMELRIFFFFFFELANWRHHSRARLLQIKK